jgi:hypothetical protein
MAFDLQKSVIFFALLISKYLFKNQTMLATIPHFLLNKHFYILKHISILGIFETSDL